MDALQIATDFIAAAEGFRADPYPDSGGKWTYGYGFTYTSAGAMVTKDTPPITVPDADAWLQTIVAAVMHNVQMMVGVPITEHQTAALTSFAYNCGTGALRNSTLLRLLNEKDYAGAVAQFGSWVYDAGKVSPGLIDRRKAEVALFNTPDEGVSNAV